MATQPPLPSRPDLYAEPVAPSVWFRNVAWAAMNGDEGARLHLVAAGLTLAEMGPGYLASAARAAYSLAGQPGLRDEWQSRVRRVAERRGDQEALRVLYGSGLRERPAVPRPPALTPEELEATLLPGERVLRYWAAPTPADPYTRPVALVAGPGWLRVFKEVADESAGPMNIADREDHAYAALAGIPGIPTYRETRAGRVMVRDVAHGRLLSSLRGCRPEVVGRALRAVAATVAAVHAAGWVVADLHPDNVMSDGTLFDLSHARRCSAGGVVLGFPATPAYVPPEVLLERQVGHAGDVYALAVMVVEMVTGAHPTGETWPGDRVGDLLYGSLASLWRDPTPRTDFLRPGLRGWVRAALRTDPARRPSAGPGVAALEKLLARPAPARVRTAPATARAPELPPDAPVVLLPMRAAVPHRGHVNLIGRWLNMGFRVTVALAQSFTATRALNPIPKWQVARYLRAALREEGYDPDAVRTLYIPYVGEAVHRLLYVMSPGWDATVAVCSGNPEVAELLGPVLEGRPVVPAEAVCGSLEDYNGTRLRAAITSNDDATVQRLACPVVYRNLAAVRAAWVAEGEEIDHVPAERVEVEFALNEVPMGGVLKPYEGPEEAILRRLQARRPRDRFEMSDWADPHGGVVVGRTVCPFRLRFTGQRIDPASGSLVLAFKPEFLSR